jgi:hypothetical protein
MCTAKLLKARLQVDTPSAMNKSVLRRAQGKAKGRLFQVWRQACADDLVISTSSAEDAGLDVTDIQELPGAKPKFLKRSHPDTTDSHLKLHLRQVLAATKTISRVRFSLSISVNRGRWRAAAIAAAKNNHAVIEVHDDVVELTDWDRKAAGNYLAKDAVQRRSMGVFDRVTYERSPSGKRKLSQAHESVITVAHQKHEQRERSITQQNHYYRDDGVNVSRVLEHLAKTRRFNGSHVLVTSPDNKKPTLVDKNLVLDKMLFR